MPISVKEEYFKPKIKLITKTKIVETNENNNIVYTFDSKNSFLDIPSIKFCFNVP